MTTTDENDGPSHRMQSLTNKRHEAEKAVRLGIRVTAVDNTRLYD